MRVGTLFDFKVAEYYWRTNTMKWVEIITLRSSANSNMQFLDALLGQITNCDNPKHLIELKIYHHSVVETDLSIHIHWESEGGSQHKSPIGLRIFSALRNMGLLNHSVWIETTASVINQRLGRSADAK
jgi:hypothetical protein